MPTVKIRGAIAKLLNDDSVLTELVDGIHSERRPPDSDYPCVVFQRESGIVSQNMSGTLSGLTQAQYLFHIYARRQDQVDDIRHCLFRILPRAKSSVVVDADSTVEIRGISPDEGHDFYVDDEEDPELWHYEIRMDIAYWENFS